MRIDLITEETSFFSLKEEWNTLLGQSGNNEITLTWEWMHTWWTTFKDASRKLLILTVRDADGQLTGIAPLQIRTAKPYRLFPHINRIEFLASGEDQADEICSDYLNFIIILRGRERAVLSTILDYFLLDLAGKWDEISLANMMADCEISRQLESLLVQSGYQKTSQEACFYISLPDTWDGFLQRSSADLRSNIRRNRKALAQEGQIGYLMAVDDTTLNQALEILIDLHQKRWTEKGKPGVFLSQKFLAFHRTLLPLSLKNHWVKLYVLSLDQIPIAAIYNFKYNNKIYFYQSGTNIHLEKKISGKISPGFLLHSHCIEEAISEGLHEYDFLSGGSIYKRRWTKTSRDLMTIRLSSKTPRIQCVDAIGQIISFLKKSRDLFRHSGMFKQFLNVGRLSRNGI